MTPVEVTRGNGPVVLGLPHTGAYVPRGIEEWLNASGRLLKDTDWHVDRLYDGLLPDVTTVRATFHRYVIDANRNPRDESLYPGRNTTSLIPLTDFDGADIWAEPPSEADIAQRCKDYHAPYHKALTTELERVRSIHGIAILYDCHSIRSHIPFLFEGTLPEFNVGTNDGTSCDPAIEDTVVDLVQGAAGYSSVLNGRFKGGWTTRHYGRPRDGIHAIQMELAQSTYLTHEAAPWAYDPAKAAQLRVHLARVLTSLVDLASSIAPPSGGST